MAKKRYFLDQTESCDWVIVPEEKKQAWEEWLRIGDWEGEHPDYIEYLSGEPNEFLFNKDEQLAWHDPEVRLPSLIEDHSVALYIDYRAHEYPILGFYSGYSGFLQYRHDEDGVHYCNSVLRWNDVKRWRYAHEEVA